MDFEDSLEMCEAVQVATPPFVSYETMHPNGGYWDEYDAVLIRKYWNLGSPDNEPSRDLQTELEMRWCIYQYFKHGNYKQSQKNLELLLELQIQSGWVFDCEFTMWPTGTYKPHERD